MDTTLYERLKELAVLVLTALVSVFSPIGNAIVALMLFFTINIFTGFQADRTVNHAEFSLKKAFEAIKLLTFYYGALLAIHISLELFGEKELAEGLTKWVTLIVCYFYLLNIARNARLVFPRSKSLWFFYSLLKVEVFDLIRRRLGIWLDVPQDRQEPNDTHPLDPSNQPDTNP